MKWLLFAVVMRCCVCEIAYGGRYKEKINLEVEPVNYGKDEYFLRIGETKKINCKGPRNQKLDWYDPSGQVVFRNSSERVYVRDPSVASYRFPTRTLTLTISTAEVKDSGEWQCRAGSVQKSVSLCVLDPVEIEIRDPERELFRGIGRSITLACPVRGEPEPTVYWVKDDEEMITDDSNSTKYKMMMNYKSQGMEALLTIISLEPADAGNYSCAATQVNPMVEACSSGAAANITLHVNYKPMFDVKERELKYFATENEEIELPCKAQAFPPATYRWFHEATESLFTEIDEQMLKYSDSNDVALRLIAEKGTFGQKYRCQASNKYGQEYIRYTIKELQKPSLPNEIIITNSTEDSIEFNLTWFEDAQKVDSIDVQYFKTTNGILKESFWRRNKVIGFVIEDFDPAENVITLTDLDEDSLYWVRLRAVNNAGESPWSSPIQADTNAKVEPESPNTKTYIHEAWSPTTDKGLLYGIIITAVIIAIGSACILIIKRV